MSNKPRILWVDDDNDDEGLLAGLMLLFKAHGIVPYRSHGYEDAKRTLWRLMAVSESSEPVTLLTDVILPQVLGMGSLAWDLGVKLAMEAAGFGIKKVGFLTVVQEREIKEGLVGVTGRGCECRIFSKLTLFDGDNIERLIHYLSDA